MIKSHKMGMSQRMNRLGIDTGFGGAGYRGRIVSSAGEWKFPCNRGSGQPALDRMKWPGYSMPDVTANGCMKRNPVCLSRIPDRLAPDVIQAWAMTCSG